MRARKGTNNLCFTNTIKLVEKKVVVESNNKFKITSLDLATTIVNRGEKEVFALYHAIQEEKETGAETAIIVSLTQTDDSIPAETLTADR